MKKIKLKNKKEKSELSYTMSKNKSYLLSEKINECHDNNNNNNNDKNHEEINNVNESDFSTNKKKSKVKFNEYNGKINLF